MRKKEFPNADRFSNGRIVNNKAKIDVTMQFGHSFFDDLRENRIFDMVYPKLDSILSSVESFEKARNGTKEEKAAASVFKAISAKWEFDACEMEGSLYAINKSIGAKKASKEWFTANVAACNAVISLVEWILEENGEIGLGAVEDLAEFCREFFVDGFEEGHVIEKVIFELGLGEKMTDDAREAVINGKQKFFRKFGFGDGMGGISTIGKFTKGTEEALDRTGRRTDKGNLN